jgi:exopolysaccharide biosynthesis polyprenyl glycosylphosphotransferase
MIRGNQMTSVPNAVLRAHALVGVSDAESANKLSSYPLAPAVLHVKRDLRHRGQRLGQWSRRYVRNLVLLDTAVGLIIIVAGTRATMGLSPELSFHWGWLIVGGISWPVSIALMQGYHRSRMGFGADEIRVLLPASVLVVLIAAVPTGVFRWQQPLTLALVLVPAASVASVCIRLVTQKQLRARQREGQFLRSVVLAGAVGSVRDLNSIFLREKHAGMRVVGVCVPQDDVASARQLGLNVLGNLDQVSAVADGIGCDAVAVTSSDTTQHSYLRELLWSLERSDVELFVHPGIIEVSAPRMHIRSLIGLSLLHVDYPHFTGWRRVAKRAVDLILTTLGLALIAPLLVVIALAIKVCDGGPIIFRQTRIGVEGRPFTMLKFRSMVVDAEERKASLAACNEASGPLFKMRQDPRVTPLGQILRDFSLDELPQLFNVLVGSMSLVGPRPQLNSEVETLKPAERRRLLVTPGMTGLWQVSGRSNLGWDDSVRLDLRYVENWSLGMDLHILWKTVRAVVGKQGSR